MLGRPAHVWERLVLEFERSGLTRGGFARLKEGNVQTLAWWCFPFRCRRLAPAATTFVELEVVTPQNASSPLRLRLDRIDGVLEIGRDVDLQLLRAVVDALC